MQGPKELQKAIHTKVHMLPQPVYGILLQVQSSVMH